MRTPRRCCTSWRSLLRRLSIFRVGGAALPDLEGFARQFFRALFATLPEGAAIVFDNCQDAGPDHAFDRLLALAVGELPDGYHLIAISRMAPGAAYARLVAREAIAFIGWSSLRLTEAETRAMATSRRALGEDELVRLHRRSAGWAAGVTLMMTRAAEGALDQDPASETQRVFDFFANELLASLEPPQASFLLRASYLPWMSAAMTADVGDEDRATEWLEDLFHRQLFVDRREARPPVYQFHPLCRAFLHERARRLLPSDDRARMTLRAARSMVDAGAVDEAMTILLEGNAWREAIELLLRHARVVMGAGRAATLKDWIEALPVTMAENDPWLQYWLGTTIKAFEPLVARVRFEKAYGDFRRSGDEPGQLASASAIVDTFILDYAALAGLEPWIDILDTLLRTGDSRRSVSEELAARVALLAATLFRRPTFPDLAEHADRAFRLLDQVSNDEAVASALILLHYATVTGEPDMPVASSGSLILLPTIPP